jgi:transposase
METPEEKYSTEKELYIAMELSQTQWKLGMSTGNGQAARVRTIAAKDVEELQKEIGLAREKYRLSEKVVVKSCYEAGLDGFWIHRYLTEQGIENVVVDSASIEVTRRAKQRKTDRLDVEKLLRQLIRYHGGDEDVWKVLHIPSVEEEDQRHLHRQLLSFKGERRRHRNRIYGILKTQGVDLKVDRYFLEEMEAVQLWNGAALPPGIQGRLRREYAQVKAVELQIKELEMERKELIASGDTPAIRQVRQLQRLRGVGDNGSWLLVMEFFGWRKFKNRREVGGLAGLAPTPYASGDSYHDQGISKAGNRWVRAMMVELAWCWLQYQPQSALTRWYSEKYDQAGKSERKKGIVALARKLLIAYWHFLDKGLVPEGALLKSVL